MAKSSTSGNSPEKNAQKHFSRAETTETLFTEMRRKEQAKDASKTARLRNLRLSKEAADKVEAEKQAAENPTAVKPAKRRAPRKKAAKVMIY